MKIEIIEKGVNHGGKKLEVGATLEIAGDKLPGHMVGKARIMKDPQRVQVTNPAEGAIGPGMSAQERQTLMGEAAKLLDDDDFNAAGMPDVRALNRELTDDVKPFTADERNQLWPGVASAVMAAREGDQ
jgi:hypothetical protein